MTRTCPSCGAESAGRFCSECGTQLDAGSCASCGNQLPAGAKFCNQCGTPISAAPSPTQAAAGRTPPTAFVPWIVAGVAIAVVVFLLLVPRGTEEPVDETPPDQAAAMGPSGVDISSMTPRERADRLFNRVMQSASSGDTAQAQAFLPMALEAFRQIPDPDLHVRYDFAVLQLVAGDATAARAQADTILQAEPSHLFGLFTAAQAEEALGNEEAAGELYERFLASYESEIQRDLPEYRDHAQVLPPSRAEAQAKVRAR